MAPLFCFQMPLFISAYAAFRGFAMHPWDFQSIYSDLQKQISNFTSECQTEIVFTLDD
jgi:hypothetical protein